MIDNRSNRSPAIIGFLVMLMTVFAYLPILNNGFIAWDDDLYIYNNPAIQQFNTDLVRWAFTTFHAYNYHPLTWISHAVDHLLWGLNPGGHHFTNILLHGLNTLLVFLLSLRFFSFVSESRANDRNRDPAAGSWSGYIGPLTVAVLFGIHPLHVESVAWAAERKDLLCAFFALLSLQFYLRYSRDDCRSRVFCYLLSLTCFALALLAKPMAVTLPVILLLLDYAPLGRLSNTPGFFQKALVVAEKIPFLLGSVAISLATVEAHKLLLPSTILPLTDRLLVAVKALSLYLTKVFLPVQLSPIYPYPEIVSLKDPGIWLPLGLFLLLAIGLLVFFRRLRVLAFCLLLWAVMLGPVSGIVQAGNQYAADRYMYLPSIPIFFLIGLAVRRVWRQTQIFHPLAAGRGQDAPCGYKFRTSRRAAQLSSIFLVGGIAAGLVLTLLSINQMAVWKDTASVYSKVLNHYPNYYDGYVSRGIDFLSKAEFSRAVDDFSRAIAIKPDNSAVFSYRGRAYAGADQPQQAAADFQQAIKLNPQELNAYNSLGDLYKEYGKYQQAIASYSKAAELYSLAWQCMTPMGVDPRREYAESLYKRGESYRLAEEYHQAITDFNRILELFPQFTRARQANELAHEQFMAMTSRQLQADPGNWIIYLNRGTINAMLKKRLEALSEYNIAAELQPKSADILFNRGIIHLELQNYQPAIDDFSQVVAIAPDDGAAYYYLAEALRQSGAGQQADFMYRQAAARGDRKAER